MGHLALTAPAVRNGGPSRDVIGAKCSECGSPATQASQGELRCQAHEIPQTHGRASGKRSHRGRARHRKARALANFNSVPLLDRSPEPRRDFEISPFRDPENTVGVPQVIHLR